MGDYNTNILNSDVDHQTSDFLDKVYSNSFFPTINTSTCISPTSRTLTDNMFYNNITKNNNKFVNVNKKFYAVATIFAFI